MGILEILGLAGSLSLLAGWRLYLTILATGIAMHFGWLPLPEHLQSLQILANPWVLGAAAVGTLAEFLADKVAWIDSIWDTIHSIIRPLGGALLALALVDTSDPAWQVVAFILGGGGALLRGLDRRGCRDDRPAGAGNRLSTARNRDRDPAAGRGDRRDHRAAPPAPQHQGNAQARDGR